MRKVAIWSSNSCNTRDLGLILEQVGPGWGELVGLLDWHCNAQGDLVNSEGSRLACINSLGPVWWVSIGGHRTGRQRGRVEGTKVWIPDLLLDSCVISESPSPLWLIIYTFQEFKKDVMYGLTKGLDSSWYLVAMALINRMAALWVHGEPIRVERRPLGEPGQSAARWGEGWMSGTLARAWGSGLVLVSAGVRLWLSGQMVTGSPRAITWPGLSPIQCQHNK